MVRPTRIALPAFVFAASVLASCGSTTSSTPSDAGAADGAPSAEVDAGDAAPLDDAVPASEYCESIANFFCDFYMRCGRMLAADVTECRTVFAETCNARYEPRYVDLEEAKLLSLSRAGIDACEAHLAAVACNEQPSDLDGPCGAMWRGLSPAGSPCAIDVESFVCAPGTTCIIGLDFCGTCEMAAPRGGACQPGGVRCAPEDSCIDGTCIARALPGQACSDTKPCIAGASCTGGACKSPTIVGEGEACDATHRCAYRAYCTGGKCVRASLLGESCPNAGACVSGRCEGGKCVPLRTEGEACTSSLECASAQCIKGKCARLPSACLTK